MSATVAAALKKIAVAILTDKKLRKTFLGIVLGIIVIIVIQAREAGKLSAEERQQR